MSVVEWFVQVFAAVGDILSFRAPAPLLDSPGRALSVAVGVAVLAGLSTMIGHAVVFVINRVRRLRMVAAMALGAVYTALLRGVTGAGIALVAWLVTRGTVDAEMVAAAYLFAAAPHVLAFGVFIPYLGLLFGRVLEVWSAVVLAFLLAPVLAVGLLPALVISGVAWLAAHLLSVALAGPLARGTARAWTLVTGHETFLTSSDVLSGAPFVPLEHREHHA
ncbi:hypothetical protein EXU48_15585 [Occultella glacieicola]|uniref:Yip1 domain-containing protein n=1 Tax=Occultella glacieicola TaxID=2518684 RepID=A0ABY2E167_9MICO|nr:hypothetical protein [Occultella glacieicola]TDE91567.1 hypothetical protein EXU48_15585 [Occultella glacieicola]